MAVWRLSNELDFFRPRVGPSSTGVDAAGGTERHTNRDRQGKTLVHMDYSGLGMV